MKGPTPSASDEMHLLREFKRLLKAWSGSSSTADEADKIRTKIIKRKRGVERILKAYGLHNSVTLIPPPAIGGPILKAVDPLDFLFDRMHGGNVRRSVADQIDAAVERVESGEKPMAQVGSEQQFRDSPSPYSSSVFLVHGRDDGAKNSVARYLEKLGLNVIILHEKPSAGRTLIEKVEFYGDTDFAVVLLNPDDEGGLGGSGTHAPRARQNVILELGYFLGRLGRKHVAALADPRVEKPSDYDGVVYIPWTQDDSWQALLRTELREAGLTIQQTLFP